MLLSFVPFSFSIGGVGGRRISGGCGGGGGRFAFVSLVAIDPVVILFVVGLRFGVKNI